MVEPPAEAQAQLLMLRQRFLERSESELEQLVALLPDQAGLVTRSLLLEAHAGLHKLAGSGGIFGCAELSVRARALELRAQSWLEAPALVSDAEWRTWLEELRALPRLLGA
ncbi:MAG: Hpt domain-containing protein [Hylemonella sp.]|uniref:Hpt domain-containing protein n=1 Tax=Hylemonella sp. TaxID=2066020 RepID=UPI0022C3D173|nr:Hpt domain-containing protein [Hylemonella sp.]MCZ8252996.1 Hpt domain-containing protein [Hylemonella sp.]